MDRRLAAIIAVDVVGYSRLIGADEAGTLPFHATPRAPVRLRAAPDRRKLDQDTLYSGIRRMILARRCFLTLLSRAGVVLGLGPLAGNLPIRSARGADSVHTLAAYLDTLIPDDVAGPGAVRAGVDERIVTEASKNEEYRSLLEAGCRWLDGEAMRLGAPEFPDLTEEDRDRVVFLAAEAEPGSLPRRFFEATRAEAFFHYYADPRAWAVIGYHGPPQPDGFTDYADPPGRAG